MAGIRIELELDDGTFTARMLHAGETVDQFNARLGATAVAMQRVDGAHRNFIGRLRDVIVVIAAARLAFENLRMVTTGWLEDIIKVNAEFERLTYLLRGMSTSSEPMKDAVDHVKQLRQIALDTPYSLKAITDTFVKLKATGLDPMQGSLKAVTDTVAAFGGNESQLKRAALALQEMAGKGVVQTKELRRQLGQDIPRAVEMMARALGVSQAQLSGLMEKGTLDAKTSMDAMFGEWERSFGGAGARMMNTFNGLLQQTQTLIQNLALDVGNAGFFDTTKKQIKELNEFLGGNKAKVLATSFGEAMASIVQGLRGALEWVIKFRSEIEHVAEVLAIAFGSRIAIAGLLGMATALRGVATTLRVFRAEWTAMQVAMQINNLNVIAGQLGIAGLGVSRLTGFVTSLRLAMTGLGITMAFVASTVIPIVAVVVSAAYAFGLFEDKVNDAYEAVKKYGVEDEKSLRLAQQKVAQDEKAFELAKKRRDQLGNRSRSYGSADGGDILTDDAQSRRDDVTAAQKQADESRRVVGQATIAWNKLQNDIAIRMENEAIAEEQTIHQRAYDEDRKKMDKAFTDKQKDLQAHHQATHALELANQQHQHEIAITEAQYQYDLIEQHIQAQKALQNAGTADPGKSAAVVADLVHQQIKLSELIAHAQSMPVGPQVNDKHMNLQDALDKADTIIKTLTGDTEKYKAQLAGANGEIAQFFYKMSDGGREKKLNIFGDEELEGKLKLAKELFAQMEALKEQAKGREKLDHDINAAYEKQVERRFQLENGSKNEAEQIRIRMAQGAGGIYGGLAPIAQLQASMKKVLSDTATNADVAASKMSKLLGPEMQTKGNGLLAILREIGGTMNGFRFNADGVNSKIKGSVLGGADAGDEPGPTGPGYTTAGGTTAENGKLQETSDLTKANDRLEAQKNATARIEELKATVKENNSAVGNLNTNVRELAKEFANPKGKFAHLGDDPESTALKKQLRDAAYAADASSAAHEKTVKAQNKLDSILSGQNADLHTLEEREADLARRFDQGGLTPKTPAREFHTVAKYDQEINTLNQDKKNGIGDPKQIDAALAAAQDKKRRMTDVEVGDVIQAEQKKNLAIEESLMTADQARETKFNAEVAREKQLMAMVSNDAKLRGEMEDTLAKKQALYQQQLLQNSPIGKMVKDWSDYGNAMQSAAAGWMNSFTDDLAKMVTTGKVNFKSLADSIIADMVRIAIRGAIGGMLGPMMGMTGAGAVPTQSSMGGGYGGGIYGGGGGKGAAVHHMGGIAGTLRASRMVDLSTFIGAQRFHEGGFPGLSRDEVPIIAMKGEEVDWPKNLAKKYGGNQTSVTHNNNVTVNASGGNAAANQDLAERVGREMQANARSLVAAEIRTAMRPGGMMRG